MASLICVFVLGCVLAVAPAYSLDCDSKVVREEGQLQVRDGSGLSAVDCDLEGDVLIDGSLTGNFCGTVHIVRSNVQGKFVVKNCNFTTSFIIQESNLTTFNMERSSLLTAMSFDAVVFRGLMDEHSVFFLTVVFGEVAITFRGCVIFAIGELSDSTPTLAVKFQGNDLLPRANLSFLETSIDSGGGFHGGLLVAQPWENGTLIISDSNITVRDETNFLPPLTLNRASGIRVIILNTSIEYPGASFLLQGVELLMEDSTMRTGLTFQLDSTGDNSTMQSVLLTNSYFVGDVTVTGWNNCVQLGAKNVTVEGTLSIARCAPLALSLQFIAATSIELTQCFHQLFTLRSVETSNVLFDAAYLQGELSLEEFSFLESRYTNTVYFLSCTFQDDFSLVLVNQLIRTIENDNKEIFALRIQGSQPICRMNITIKNSLFYNPKYNAAFHISQPMENCSLVILNSSVVGSILGTPALTWTRSSGGRLIVYDSFISAAVAISWEGHVIDFYNSTVVGRIDLTFSLPQNEREGSASLVKTSVEGDLSALCNSQSVLFFIAGTEVLGGASFRICTTMFFHARNWTVNDEVAFTNCQKLTLDLHCVFARNLLKITSSLYPTLRLSDVRVGAVAFSRVTFNGSLLLSISVTGMLGQHAIYFLTCVFEDDFLLSIVNNKFVVIAESQQTYGLRIQGSASTVRMNVSICDSFFDTSGRHNGGIYITQPMENLSFVISNTTFLAIGSESSTPLSVVASGSGSGLLIVNSNFSFLNNPVQFEGATLRIASSIIASQVVFTSPSALAVGFVGVDDSHIGGMLDITGTFQRVAVAIRNSRLRAFAAAKIQPFDLLLENCFVEAGMSFSRASNATVTFENMTGESLSVASCESVLLRGHSLQLKIVSFEGGSNPHFQFTEGVSFHKLLFQGSELGGVLSLKGVTITGVADNHALWFYSCFCEDDFVLILSNQTITSVGETAVTYAVAIQGSRPIVHLTIFICKSVITATGRKGGGIMLSQGAEIITVVIGSSNISTSFDGAAPLKIKSVERLSLNIVDSTVEGSASSVEFSPTKFPDASIVRLSQAVFASSFDVENSRGNFYFQVGEDVTGLFNLKCDSTAVPCLLSNSSEVFGNIEGFEFTEVGEVPSGSRLINCNEMLDFENDTKDQLLQSDVILMIDHRSAIENSCEAFFVSSSTTWPVTLAGTSSSSLYLHTSTKRFLPNSQTSSNSGIANTSKALSQRESEASLSPSHTVQIFPKPPIRSFATTVIVGGAADSIQQSSQGAGAVAGVTQPTFASVSTKFGSITSSVGCQVTDEEVSLTEHPFPGPADLWEIPIAGPAIITWVVLVLAPLTLQWSGVHFLGRKHQYITGHIVAVLLSYFLPFVCSAAGTILFYPMIPLAGVVVAVFMLITSFVACGSVALVAFRF